MFILVLFRSGFSNIVVGSTGIEKNIDKKIVFTLYLSTEKIIHPQAILLSFPPFFAGDMMNVL